MKLLDAYGNTISRDDVVGKEIGTSSSRAQSLMYPARGLNPERLAAIFSEADYGDITRQSELFEEMEEKDAHLASVLQTRKLAVAGLPWEVSGENAEARAFVQGALSSIEDFGGALLDMMDAVGKGFSASEIIWRQDGGRVAVERIAWRHPRNFTFYTRTGAPSERPMLITDEEPVYGTPLEKAKFVVHRYKGRSGSAMRAGVLRPCAWLYLFKNYTLKDWVIFAERYAQPLRIGKFSPGASEADRRVLRDAVMNMGADAAAVISDATMIELLETTGKTASADIYASLAAYCDRAMSKAVLGQTLTTDQDGGAYATARVHQQVREDIIAADAGALAGTINSQLVAPLVAFNFPPGTPLPRFAFRMEPAEDMKTLAEVLKTIKEMGVGIPDGYIREKFGIPESADE